MKEVHCEAALSPMEFAQGTAVIILHVANSVQEGQGLFPKSELWESALCTYNLTSGIGNLGRVRWHSQTNHSRQTDPSLFLPLGPPTRFRKLLRGTAVNRGRWPQGISLAGSSDFLVPRTACRLPTLLFIFIQMKPSHRLTWGMVRCAG